MEVVRNTIKSFSRAAIAATRGDKPEITVITVKVLGRPRNENAWTKAAKEFCECGNLDFIRFTADPELKKATYEMDVQAFIAAASLVSEAGEEE